MDNNTLFTGINQSHIDDCKPSCSNHNTDNINNSPIQYFGDFGRYLSEQYSVLKLVLCHLDYYDLCTMRRVNSTFKSVADIILLRNRMHIQYTTLEYKQGINENCLSENMLIDKKIGNSGHSNHCIDLRIEPKTLFTFECMPGSGGPSRCRPKICTRLRESTSRNNGDDRSRDTGGFFPRGDIVPNSVTTFIPIGAKGIIYTGNKSKNKNSMELLVSYSSHDKKLVLLYLPTSKKYEVNVFTRVITSNSSASVNCLSQDESMLFNQQGSPIRGLIFLKVGSSTQVDTLIKSIVKLATESNNSIPIAVSGGHITSLDYNNPQKKKNSLIPGVLEVIIFRGNGIHCISDVISSTTEPGIIAGLKDTMKHIKETCLLEGITIDSRRSFILSFQCIDRQQLEDHKYLSKIFPNIPLFGVQTWGEIGLRSFTNDESNCLTNKKKKFSIMHSVKTTFMFVTLN
ncbi:uncharacterized protein LOC126910416 [Daktulosphaira vitifoliae]|uniref:uncharacterized protein LOC126910416 n=1 Tax=Daktulosphaira vitifoliae TaxID=58002 RepID=UPI0021A9E4FF|nr:uncharacterized protein LOC126910416 [Daktulosphaira vitifoliae]